MKLLVVKAYTELIRFEGYLARGEFGKLHGKVLGKPLSGATAGTDGIQEVCAAVDLACIWYWKQVRCLQRSAATTCLLRDCGIPARMVIGVQQIPFKAHAWVEVNGRVVNDKPYMREVYTALETC